ncbi:ABC transporter substrate-binding protein [Peptostreptococcaceae bacterium AGR-M142]
MKKILIFILSLALIMTGCQTKEVKESKKTTKYGGKLVVAQKMSLPHLDTDKSTDWAIAAVMNHVYEGLFEFSDEFEAKPHLAKDYKVLEGGKIYEIFLREDVLFHNNENMKAKDVLASFDRWLDNNDAGNMVKPYLKEVRIDNDYKLTFEFKKPYAPFINILASHVSNQKLVIRPKKIIDEYKDNIIKEHIGTGPYMLDDYILDQYVRMKKFDNYVPNENETSGLYGKRIAYIDEIEFRVIKEEAIRMAGVKTGEFLFAEEGSKDEYEMLLKNKDVTPLIVKPDGMEMLIINCANKPFDDKFARKALAYGIDLEDLGYSMIGNKDFWDLQGCLYPKSSIWYDENAGKGIYNEYDLKKAKDLLKKSNYNGQKIIILSGQDDKVEKRGAIALKSQLEKIGFNVELNLFDRPTVVENRSKKDTWHLHLSYFYKAVSDPQVQHAWTGTNKWISNWDDEDSKTMDEIFARMIEETDFDKRFEIVKEFYDKTWESVPYMNLLDYSRMHVKNNKLKGYRNIFKPCFWNTWIEE